MLWLLDNAPHLRSARFLCLPTWPLRAELEPSMRLWDLLIALTEITAWVGRLGAIKGWIAASYIRRLPAASVKSG